MLYLGIDIGKNTHVASLLDETEKSLFKAFSFSNTTDGANSLIEKLSYHANVGEIAVGLEATGHYWLSVYSTRFRPMVGVKAQKSESVKLTR